MIALSLRWYERFDLLFDRIHSVVRLGLRQIEIRWVLGEQDHVRDDLGQNLLDRDGITDDIHLFNANLREWEDYYNYHRLHGALAVRPRTSGSWQRREPEPHRRPENLQTATWRVSRRVICRKRAGVLMC